MDRTSQQWGFREGDEVYAADGAKLGKVIAVQPGYVVVERGFFFPTDSYIPLGAVAAYEDGKIRLSVAKDATLAQGWDVVPTGEAPVTAAAAGATRIAEGETLRVPVREEELTATTRERELGAVRVEKDVVAEERVLEVPVTEERVRVERRVVDRPVDASDATAFEEGVIAVPIRGEEVELRKQARVVEEVEIGKEAVERTERVAGTVRREEVRIRVDVVDTDVTTGPAREGGG